MTIARSLPVHGRACASPLPTRICGARWWRTPGSGMWLPRPLESFSTACAALRRAVFAFPVSGDADAYPSQRYQKGIHNNWTFP